MELNTRQSTIAGWAILGLIIWFIAAVVAVGRSGNCWSSCDDEVFIAYDARPLGLWLAGVGAAICVRLWSLALRRGASWLKRLGAAVPASIATGYFLVYVRLVV